MGIQDKVTNVQLGISAEIEEAERRGKWEARPKAALGNPHAYLEILESRHPNGFVIGRQRHPPYWEFYNASGVWAGSGTVYPTRERAEETKAALLELTHTRCAKCGEYAL